MRVFDDLTFETETVPDRRCSIRKSSLHEWVYTEGKQRTGFIGIRRRVGRTVFRLVARAYVSTETHWDPPWTVPGLPVWEWGCRSPRPCRRWWGWRWVRRSRSKTDGPEKPEQKACVSCGKVSFIRNGGVTQKLTDLQPEQEAYVSCGKVSFIRNGGVAQRLTDLNDQNKRHVSGGKFSFIRNGVVAHRLTVPPTRTGGI